MYAVLFLQHYFSNFYSSACLGLERSIGASLPKGPLARGAGKPSAEMSVLGGLAVLGFSPIRDAQGPGPHMPRCRKSTMCISGGES